MRRGGGGAFPRCSLAGLRVGLSASTVRGDARAGPLGPCRFAHGCLWGQFPAVTARRSAGDEKAELSLGEHPPRVRYRWLEGPALPGRAARSEGDREVLPHRARGAGPAVQNRPRLR